MTYLKTYLKQALKTGQCWMDSNFQISKYVYFTFRGKNDQKSSTRSMKYFGPDPLRLKVNTLFWKFRSSSYRKY